jgi:hypothetical protein
LTNFGLSKKIDNEYKERSDLFVIPYIDPKRFNTKSYPLNKKSNVYSVGVLLWEISKGQPPFYSEGELYDNKLAMQILQGLREKVVPDTPVDYVKLYTGNYNIFIFIFFNYDYFFYFLNLIIIKYFFFLFRMLGR